MHIRAYTFLPSLKWTVSVSTLSCKCAIRKMHYTLVMHSVILCTFCVPLQQGKLFVLRKLSHTFIQVHHQLQKLMVLNTITFIFFDANTLQFQLDSKQLIIMAGKCPQRPNSLIQISPSHDITTGGMINLPDTNLYCTAHSMSHMLCSLKLSAVMNIHVQPAIIIMI